MVSERSDSSLANRYVTKSVHFVPQNYEEYCGFMEAHMVEIDGHFHIPWLVEDRFEYLALEEEDCDSIPTMVEASREVQELVPTNTLVSFFTGFESSLGPAAPVESALVKEEKKVQKLHQPEEVKEKKEAAKLIVPNAPTYAYAQEVLDETPELNTCFHGYVEYVFDPGIANETINIAMGLEYLGKEDVIDLKHEDFVTPFDYVVENEALTIEGIGIEWRIAWELEGDVYTMGYLGGNDIEWRIAWVLIQSKIKEDSRLHLGDKVS